jgi:molecular chaperone DnaK
LCILSIVGAHLLISCSTPQTPYKIVPHSNGDAYVEGPGGKKISPQEVAAIVLGKMKEVKRRLL